MKNWISSLKVLTLAFTVLLATSCGQQGSGLPQINGVKGPIFNVIEGQIVLTLKFLNLDLDAGLGGNIPKTQNSRLELSPNVVDGGMMLQMYFDFEDLEDLANVEIEGSCVLPDDRPIPGVPGGELENCMRVDTDWKKISLFYNNKLFGLWMPFGFETATVSGYWNFKISGKNAGMLGILGNDPVNGHKAGGIIFLRLESLKSRQLQNLIELSRRNPHLVY